LANDGAGYLIQRNYSGRVLVSSLIHLWQNMKTQGPKWEGFQKNMILLHFPLAFLGDDIYIGD